MTFIIWFLVAIATVLVALSIVLMVVFVRLGRDLGRMGEDTNSMMRKIQQKIHVIQIVVPLFTFAHTIIKRSKLDTIKIRKKPHDQ